MNNPFKLWGSYVGALLANIIPTFPANTLGGTGLVMPISIINPTTIKTLWFILLGYAIIGFLTGWLIHSLIRKIF